MDAAVGCVLPVSGKASVRRLVSAGWGAGVLEVPELLFGAEELEDLEELEELEDLEEPEELEDLEELEELKELEELEELKELEELEEPEEPEGSEEVEALSVLSAPFDVASLSALFDVASLSGTLFKSFELFVDAYELCSELFGTVMPSCSAQPLKSSAEARIRAVNVLCIFFIADSFLN